MERSEQDHREITSLAREYREADKDNKIEDWEQERLSALAQRVRSFAERGPDENAQAYQRKQQALMRAIDAVARREGVPDWRIIGLIWPRRSDRAWFEANVREKPHATENAVKAMSALEDAWKSVADLGASEREARSEHRDLWRYIQQMEDILDGCSEPQIEELVTKHQLFRRLAAVHRSMYGKADGVYCREVMRSVAILAARVPALAAAEAVAGNFIENSTALVRSVLGRRDLFFAMARNGPTLNDDRFGRRTYMNHTSYRNMAADLRDGKITLPKGLRYDPKDPLAAEREVMYLYNGGGYELADTLAGLARARNPKLTEQIRTTKILQHLFQLATYPSTWDGHVSLCVHVLGCMAEIAETDPGLFDDFIDVKDAALGQTPRQFFVANAREGDRIPFDELTVHKRNGAYQHACRRLIAALGVGEGGVRYQGVYQRLGERVERGIADAGERRLLFQTIRDSLPGMDGVERSFYRRFLLLHDTDGPEASALTYQNAYELYGGRVRDRTATAGQRRRLFATLRSSLATMGGVEREFYRKFLVEHDPGGPEAKKER